MTWRKYRRLKKHIKNVRFDVYLKNYGKTGEYGALCWLRYYVNSKTKATSPLEIVKSFLRNSSEREPLTDFQRSYIITLLEWC